MPVKYRKVQRKVLNGPEQGKVKTYAVAKGSYHCGMERLCNLVSARTKMWDSEVMSVLQAFLWVMQMELQEGAIVKMANFGTFKYSIKSEGTEDPKEFKAHHIKGVKLRFYPGVQLKHAATQVGFAQDDVKEVIVEEECTLPHG